MVFCYTGGQVTSPNRTRLALHSVVSTVVLYTVTKQLSGSMSIIRTGRGVARRGQQQGIGMQKQHPPSCQEDGGQKGQWTTEG